VNSFSTDHWILFTEHSKIVRFMKTSTANRINWRSNSFLSIATAMVILIALAVLAYVTPPLGGFLLMCSTGPVLLLVISAIHWADREKSGLKFAAAGIVVIVLVYVALFSAHMPEDPEPLTLDALAQISMGYRYEDIAGEIGGGDWFSEAESFTVAYQVEGDRVLLLVFEDGIHLSSATLHEISDIAGGMFAENKRITTTTP